MTTAVIVYITTGSMEEARSISRTLVTEHLAACSNIIDGMQSFYQWEGKLCEDRESIIICKTQQNLLEPLIQRTRGLHSYTCPCIVAYPVIGGNPEYLAWVERETS